MKQFRCACAYPKAVSVRPYSRIRNDHLEFVRAHCRRYPGQQLNLF